MEKNEIVAGFKEILATMPDIDKEAIEGATEESCIIQDLGAASTEIVNIVAKAEEKFGIEFEDDDVDELGSTIGDSIQLIEKYLK